MDKLRKEAETGSMPSVSLSKSLRRDTSVSEVSDPSDLCFYSSKMSIIAAESSLREWSDPIHIYDPSPTSPLGYWKLGE